MFDGFSKDSGTLTEEPVLEQLAHINNTFPPEILSHIFILSVPTYDIYKNGSLFTENSDAPLHIAGVCRLWKEIAWNTPSLWAFIVFNLQGSGSDSTEKPDDFSKRLLQVHRWLSRSGSVPLSISIVDYADGEKSESSRDVMHALFYSLSQYAHRVEHINANITGPGLTEYRDFVHQAPNLRSFSFKIFNSELCDLRAEYFHLSDHRCLTTVSLNQISMRWFSPNWKRVTHLRLRHFYVDECLQAISQSTNLVHLSLRYVTVGHDDLGLPSSPVRLPSLQYLDWYSGPRMGVMVDLETFFSKLITPVLRVVRWMSYHRRFHPSAINNFFRDCSQSLKVFIVGYSGSYDDEFIDHEGHLLGLWSQSPQLTIVDLDPCIIQQERSEMRCLTEDSIRMYDNPLSDGWGSVGYFLPAMKASESSRKSENTEVSRSS